MVECSLLVGLGPAREKSPQEKEDQRLHKDEWREDDRPPHDAPGAPIEEKGQRNTEKDEQDGGDAKREQRQSFFCHRRQVCERPRSAARAACEGYEVPGTNAAAPVC